MSTEELIRRIEARGLRLDWDVAACRPVLVGDRRLASAALLRVLAYHRDALVDRLRPRAEPSQAVLPAAVQRTRGEVAYCRRCRRNWGREWIGASGLCPECQCGL